MWCYCDDTFLIQEVGNGETSQGSVDTECRLIFGKVFIGKVIGGNYFRQYFSQEELKERTG